MTSITVDGGLFNRHRVSRTRRTRMRIRVEVRDGETIAEAIRRFRNIVYRFSQNAADQKRSKDFYIKPSQRVRNARLKKRWLNYFAECARRGLEPLSRNGVRQWEGRFGNIPLLDDFPDPLIPHLQECHACADLCESIPDP